jgi:hypothetical protein
VESLIRHLSGFRVYQALRPKPGGISLFNGSLIALTNRPEILKKSASAKAGEVEGRDDTLAVWGVDFDGCVCGCRIGRVVFLPDNKTS